MQIKRFEAADMTESLRLVKSEFGDDAVILSAKEVRTGGFFKNMRKKSVEITAAIDYCTKDAGKTEEFSKMLTKQLGGESKNDRVTLTSKQNSEKPSCADTPSLSSQTAIYQQNSDSMGSHGGDWKPESTPGHTTRAVDGTNDDHAKSETSTPHNLHQQKPVTVARPFFEDISQRKIIALVGSHGAGKSTTLAKLAWHCHFNEKLRVALISLDRYSIAANAILTSVSQIVKIPLTVVHDTNQLESTLNEFLDMDVVLIDTPGLGRKDATKMADIDELLRAASPDETHLVVNGTGRKEVIDSTADMFSLFPVNRLLYTHMDETDEWTFMQTVSKRVHLPVVFYGDGVDPLEDLKTMGDNQMTDPSFPHSHEGRDVLDICKTPRMDKPIQDIDIRPEATVQYVANKNSELFHLPDCKSVKNVNPVHMTVFHSMQQALDSGCRPCQACCTEQSLIRQSSTSFYHRHANAI